MEQAKTLEKLLKDAEELAADHKANEYAAFVGHDGILQAEVGQLESTIGKRDAALSNQYERNREARTDLLPSAINTARAVPDLRLRGIATELVGRISSDRSQRAIMSLARANMAQFREERKIAQQNARRDSRRKKR